MIGDRVKKEQVEREHQREPLIDVPKELSARHGTKRKALHSRLPDVSCFVGLAQQSFRILTRCSGLLKGPAESRISCQGRQSRTLVTTSARACPSVP